jgi:predicted regulator of Ras-like GTPase activity (Roadblock/LC7/MglB family)
MSAAQSHAIYASLTEALEAVRTAGQFRAVALADARGLLWSLAGEIGAPDRLSAIPSLITRAFTDRQPLLRFFSDKGMRFEYHSDTLAYVKAGVEGLPSSTDFLLDVPSDKAVKGGRAPKAGRDADGSQEFVVLWNDEFLVMRHIKVGGEDWCLLGIAVNPIPARVALQKGAPGIAARLDGLTHETLGTARRNAGEMALHARMSAELEGFRASASEILLGAVTSKDGFVVAALDGAVEAELVAPLIGHSFLAIQESTQRLCGETECVMLRMDEGILLARELTDDLLFAALLAPTASTGLILAAFEAAAQGLRAALESMATASSSPSESVGATEKSFINAPAPQGLEAAA